MPYLHVLAQSCTYIDPHDWLMITLHGRTNLSTCSIQYLHQQQVAKEVPLLKAREGSNGFWLVCSGTWVVEDAGSQAAQELVMTCLPAICGLVWTELRTAIGQTLGTGWIDVDCQGLQMFTL